MIALLLAATLCLPPGIDLTGAALTSFQARVLLGQRETEFYVVVDRLYRLKTGRDVSVTSFMNSAAIVDEEPRNPEATDFWIDPGMVTDDVPTKAQADPHGTCQWRHRKLGDKEKT